MNELDSGLTDGSVRTQAGELLVMRIGSLFSFSARYDRNVVPGCE